MLLLILITTIKNQNFVVVNDLQLPTSQLTNLKPTIEKILDKKEPLIFQLQKDGLEENAFAKGKEINDQNENGDRRRTKEEGKQNDEKREDRQMYGTKLARANEKGNGKEEEGEHYDYDYEKRGDFMPLQKRYAEYGAKEPDNQRVLNDMPNQRRDPNPPRSRYLDSPDSGRRDRDEQPNAYRPRKRYNSGNSTYENEYNEPLDNNYQQPKYKDKDFERSMNRNTESEKRENISYNPDRAHVKGDPYSVRNSYKPERGKYNNPNAPVNVDMHSYEPREPPQQINREYNPQLYFETQAENITYNNKPTILSNYRRDDYVDEKTPERINTNLHTSIPYTLPSYYDNDQRATLQSEIDAHMLEATTANLNLINLDKKASEARITEIESDIAVLNNSLEDIEERLKSRKIELQAFHSDLFNLKHIENNIGMERNKLIKEKNKYEAELRLLDNEIAHLKKKIEDLISQKITKSGQVDVFAARISDEDKKIEESRNNYYLEEHKKGLYETELIHLEEQVKLYKIGIQTMMSKKAVEEKILKDLEQKEEWLEMKSKLIE